jgi:hypothetical protein
MVSTSAASSSHVSGSNQQPTINDQAKIFYMASCMLKFFGARLIDKTTQLKRYSRLISSHLFSSLNRECSQNLNRLSLLASVVSSQSLSCYGIIRGSLSTGEWVEHHSSSTAAAFHNAVSKIALPVHHHPGRRAGAASVNDSTIGKTGYPFAEIEPNGKPIGNRTKRSRHLSETGTATPKVHSTYSTYPSGAGLRRSSKDTRHPTSCHVTGA